MSDVLRLHGLGAVVEVRCTGAAAAHLSSAMHAAWTRCLMPTSPPTEEAEPLEVRLDDVAELPRRMMLITQDVTRALIGARAGHLLMFHAGAVSDPATGRSVVYVARGGTGKTTLSRLLGQRLGYLTDETVGIDESGTILPYPKPLSVRREADADVKDELSPDDLGLQPAPVDPRISRVILLDRRSDVGAVEHEELAFMDALFGLVEQSSALPRLTRPLHRLADLIDKTGPVVRLRYREATEVADDLVALIGVSA